MSDVVYLVSDDTMWGDEPCMCSALVKFKREGREYWLVKVSPPFVVPTYGEAAKSQIQGEYGERTNSEYFVIVPRHEGVTFERLKIEAVCVHVAVPKYDRYPPDQNALDLDYYVHLFWGLAFPSFELAKKGDFSF
ncbi:MAG: hypothetical protein K8S25_10160 [Alphaproteobacteria bacterium]|nr:hypothetical protein [Alphaproteobacteria bacterium]